MTQGRPDPRAIFSLDKALRAWSPHVIQTWMYHADLLGGLVGKLLRGTPVVWNVRHNDLQSGVDHWMTLRIAECCGFLSRWIPARIVCCAQSSRRIHARLGYRWSKMAVIPNGFDLEVYRPHPGAGGLCQERFGIPPDRSIVSLVARYHPHKDHVTFFAAAALCAYRYPETLFALCGDGITTSNTELMRLIRQAGLGDRVYLLGRCAPKEIALIMSRSTVVTSSSSSEAFPNVIGEAMACGAVCVVTDVGDSAYIVGDAGISVAPRSPEDLANGWMRVFEMDDQTRGAFGRSARERIEHKFSLPVVASQYEDLYLEVVGAPFTSL
jgi:glycosyltransferase involved in cell wall biosynthesis